jgi:hypothetical protein
MVGALWIFYGIARFMGEPWTNESITLAVLASAVSAGVLVSWWNASLGGLILGVCGILSGVFAYTHADHYKWLGSVLTGGPVFLAGILLLASWWTLRDQ